MKLTRNDLPKTLEETLKQTLLEVPWDVLTTDTIPRQRQPQGAAVVALITNDFRTRFESTLAPADLNVWLERGLGCGERIPHLFDKFIFDQARTMGPWLLVLEPVQARMLQWWRLEQDGPMKFARLGRELELGARVLWGKAKLPIDDRAWYRFKRAVVVEFRTLLRRLRGHMGRRLPTTAELISLIENEVKTPSHPYPFIEENLGSLTTYLGKHDAEAGRIATGLATPARFVDEWIAWSTNRDPESVRKRISSLRPRL